MKATPLKLQRILQRLFAQQAREVASKLNLDQGTLPDMTHWTDTVAEAVKPLLLSMWQQGMVKAGAAIGASAKLEAKGLLNKSRTRMVLVVKDVEKASGDQVARAWSKFTDHDGPRRQLWARELASALGMNEQELTKLNRQLGGEYRGGWEENTQSGYRILAGDRLWKEIKRLAAAKVWYEATGGARSYLEPEPGSHAPLWRVGDAIAKAAKPVITVDFDLFDPKVLDAVDAAAYAFCRDTMATATGDMRTALDRLRELMRTGLARGDAVQLLAREVRNIFADPARAFRIATTETSRAMHAGSRMAGVESGVVSSWSWLCSSDACEEICQPLDGKTVKQGEPYVILSGKPPYNVIWHPPAHPHCFCTETENVD